MEDVGGQPRQHGEAELRADARNRYQRAEDRTFGLRDEGEEVQGVLSDVEIREEMHVRPLVAQFAERRERNEHAEPDASDVNNDAGRASSEKATPEF